MNDDRFKIFTGTANRPLAQSICEHLGTKLGQMRLERFSDGEIYLQILENVRGADVFVVQPCCHPVDNHLLELLLMIDAFKRASAWRKRRMAAAQLGVGVFPASPRSGRRPAAPPTAVRQAR